MCNKKILTEAILANAISKLDQMINNYLYEKVLMIRELILEQRRLIVPGNIQTQPLLEKDEEIALLINEVISRDDSDDFYQIIPWAAYSLYGHENAEALEERLTELYTFISKTTNLFTRTFSALMLPPESKLRAEMMENIPEKSRPEEALDELILERRQLLGCSRKYIYTRNFDAKLLYTIGSKVHQEKDICMLAYLKVASVEDGEFSAVLDKRFEELFSPGALDILPIYNPSVLKMLGGLAFPTEHPVIRYVDKMFDKYIEEVDAVSVLEDYKPWLVNWANYPSRVPLSKLEAFRDLFVRVKVNMFSESAVLVG